MKPTFILSLDCEGKWGVADNLTPDHEKSLSDDRLRFAYKALVDLLDRHQIPSTFAFVGAFTWSRETADLEALRAFAGRAPNYIGPALRDMERSDGWFGEWALDLVPTSHEIALHGATHLPWGSADEATARAELELLATMPRVAGATTYVFPRNQVRHTHLLAAAGIKSWRAARPMTRLRSLLSEFNVNSPPDPHGLPIPAGRFVNWQHGARKLVPVQLSRLRARKMLENAAANGGVVHYWTHPENIASEPRTLDVLDAILAEVAEFRRRGLIATMTQDQYVRQFGAPEV